MNSEIDFTASLDCEALFSSKNQLKLTSYSPFPVIDFIGGKPRFPNLEGKLFWFGLDWLSKLVWFGLDRSQEIVVKIVAIASSMMSFFQYLFTIVHSDCEQMVKN